MLTGLLPLLHFLHHAVYPCSSPSSTTSLYGILAPVVLDFNRFPAATGCWKEACSAGVAPFQEAAELDQDGSRLGCRERRCQSTAGLETPLLSCENASAAAARWPLAARPALRRRGLQSLLSPKPSRSLARAQHPSLLLNYVSGAAPNERRQNIMEPGQQRLLRGRCRKLARLCKQLPPPLQMC